MSTVQRVNFEPVSDINPIHRRDFPLTTPALADPTNAVALVDGEWMTLDTTLATIGKLKRATDITALHNLCATLAFPLFAERGRYDVQAISDRKMPILFLGQYEFKTRIFNASDTTITVGSGGAHTGIDGVLQPLAAATIQIGTRYYTGLIGAYFAHNGPIVGYVTRLPAQNGGQLRFMSGWAVQNGAT
jgi:hypothetical protein